MSRFRITLITCSIFWVACLDTPKFEPAEDANADAKPSDVREDDLSIDLTTRDVSLEDLDLIFDVDVARIANVPAAGALIGTPTSGTVVMGSTLIRNDVPGPLRTWTTSFIDSEPNIVIERPDARGTVSALATISEFNPALVNVSRVNFEIEVDSLASDLRWNTGNTFVLFSKHDDIGSTALQSSFLTLSDSGFGRTVVDHVDRGFYQLIEARPVAGRLPFTVTTRTLVIGNGMNSGEDPTLVVDGRSTSIFYSYTASGAVNPQSGFATCGIEDSTVQCVRSGTAEDLTFFIQVVEWDPAVATTTHVSTSMMGPTEQIMFANDALPFFGAQGTFAVGTCTETSLVPALSNCAVLLDAENRTLNRDASAGPSTIWWQTLANAAPVGF